MPSAEVKTRRKPRLKTRVTANFVFGGQLVQGTVIDFSEVGFFVVSGSLPEVGNVLTFYLEMENGDREIALQGRVVGHRGNPRGGKTGSPVGMGVEIVSIPDAFLSYIKNLRSERLKAGEQSSKRFELDWPVRLKLGSAYLTERMRDLSLGGMFMQTKQGLKPGEVIHASIELPGRERPFEICGRVIHKLDEQRASTLGKPTGVGIQFVDLSEEAHGYLHHFLRRLEVHRFSQPKRTDGVPLAGSLKDYTVAEILAHLFVQKATGVLELKHREVKKQIYISQGNPVYVESYLRTETLSQYLIRSGTLSRKVVQRTLDELAATDLHHGELLLRKGMLTSDQLNEALVLHQEEKIENTFSWYYGSYHFNAEARWPSNISVFPLRTFQMLFSGVSKWLTSDVLGVWTGLDEESVLVLKEGFAIEHYVPEPVFHLIKVLKEPVQLGDLSTRLNWPLEDLLPFVYAMLLVGWVEPYSFALDQLMQQRKVPGSNDVKNDGAIDEGLKRQIDRDYVELRGQNFYDLLQVKSPVDVQLLQSQFTELNARYPINRILGLDDTELQGKALEIRLWLETAFNTLSHPKLRVAYDGLGQKRPRSATHRRRIVTEGRLLKALIDLNAGKVTDAVQLLHHALDEDRDDPTLAGYLGWGLFVQDPSGNVQRACTLIDQAVERDPADPYLRYFLGEIESKRGKWGRARSYYQTAIRLHPSVKKAKAAYNRAVQASSS